MHSLVHICITCFLIFIVVNIHTGSATYSGTTSRCPVNEEYNQCGSACPAVCSDLFFPLTTKFCTKQCVAGCFCKAGLFRARNGECVKPDACCTRRNEVYQECGTACPAICNTPPGPCADVCAQGCFCKIGFIRRDNSTNSPCISSDRC